MYQENAPRQSGFPSRRSRRRRPMSDPQSSQSDLAVAPSRPSRPSHHSLVGSAQAQSPESSQLGGLLLQLQLGTLQHAGCQLVVLEPRCDASRHWTQARSSSGVLQLCVSLQPVLVAAVGAQTALVAPVAAVGAQTAPVAAAVAAVLTWRRWRRRWRRY